MERDRKTFEFGEPEAALKRLLGDLRADLRTNVRTVVLPGSLVVDTGKSGIAPGVLRSALRRETEKLGGLDRCEVEMCVRGWGLHGHRETREQIADDLGVHPSLIARRQAKARKLLANRLYARPIKIAGEEQQATRAVIETAIGTVFLEHLATRRELQGRRVRKAPMEVKTLDAYLLTRAKRELLRLPVPSPTMPADRHPWNDAALRFLARVNHLLDAGGPSETPSWLDDQLVTTGRWSSSGFPYIGWSPLVMLAVPESEGGTLVFGNPEVRLEHRRRGTKWFLDHGLRVAAETWLRDIDDLVVSRRSLLEAWRLRWNARVMAPAYDGREMRRVDVLHVSHTAEAIRRIARRRGDAFDRLLEFEMRLRAERLAAYVEGRPASSPEDLLGVDLHEIRALDDCDVPLARHRYIADAFGLVWNSLGGRSHMRRRDYFYDGGNDASMLCIDVELSEEDEFQAL